MRIFINLAICILICCGVCRSIDYEIVIVEDNSPDGTLEAAKQLQAIFGKSRIIIVSRPAKLGLGSAYIDGLKASSGDFIFLMDADLSHHPRYIPEFIRSALLSCPLLYMRQQP